MDPVARVQSSSSSAPAHAVEAELADEQKSEHGSNVMQTLQRLFVAKESGTLDVTSMKLQECPGELANIPSLTQLYIDRNNLTILGDVIASLPGLLLLSAQHNRLCKVTPLLTRLNSLKELMLSNNEFTAIPSEILLLSSLKKLEMEHNFITDLA